MPFCFKVENKHLIQIWIKIPGFAKFSGFVSLLMLYSKIYLVFKILSHAIFGMYYSNQIYLNPIF